jgi:hypothetical protein
MQLASIVRDALLVVLFTSFAFLDAWSVASKARANLRRGGQQVTNANQFRPSGTYASEDPEVQS